MSSISSMAGSMMVGRSCFAAVDVKGSRDLVSCPATASGRKSGARRRHPNVDGDESEAGDGAQMPRGEPGPELRAYEHGQQARESERGGGGQEYAGAIDLRAGPQPLSSHARSPRFPDSCPNHLLGSSSLLPWVSDPPPRGWPEPSTRNGPGFGLSPVLTSFPSASSASIASPAALREAPIPCRLRFPPFSHPGSPP